MLSAEQDAIERRIFWVYRGIAIMLPKGLKFLTSREYESHG